MRRAFVIAAACRVFPGSSVVEQPAVNRLVAGSNPARGATEIKYLANRQLLSIAAGLPWLSYSCPACNQVGSVGVRTLDRHSGAAISSLILSVSCRRCSPNAAFARIEMLTAEHP